MTYRLLSVFALMMAFQTGCDALKGGSDKAKKDETEEDEDEDKDKKKKKKKKSGDGESSAAANSATAAPSGTPAAGGNAPALIDGPPQ